MMEAVESLLGQDLDPLEIVVVDKDATAIEALRAQPR